ncbi:hypothetical protein GCM10020000_44520 [Streptomyces olivoverticillatus]
MKPHISRDETRTGLLCSVAAYSIWGLFPLYWPLLEPTSAAEILAHRMVWSLVTVALALLATRRLDWIRPLLRQPKRIGMIALGALFISVNWGVYIWGVNTGHVVDTSMGYFINPPWSASPSASSCCVSGCGRCSGRRSGSAPRRSW